MQHQPRAVPQNLNLIASAQLGSVYVYVAAHDINRMTMPDYWLNGDQARLRPGDTIMLRQITVDRSRLVAYGTVVVVESARDGVLLSVDALVDVTAKPEPESEPEIVVHRRWNVGTRKYEVRAGDQLLGEFDDKDEADSAVAEFNAPRDQAA